MKNAFLFTLLWAFASAFATPQTPEIVTVEGRWGIKFYHFAYELRPGNFRIGQLDEKAEQFRHGQFELFIPTTELRLPRKCASRSFIARMAQSHLRDAAEIARKQALYWRIRDIARGKEDAVQVVLEWDQVYYRCNLFFRTAKGNAYIDYVGPLRP